MYTSLPLSSVSVSFRHTIGSDHCRRQESLRKEKRWRVVVVVVDSLGPRVLWDWDRLENCRRRELLQGAGVFWVLGAGAARGWVGFGRMGHFSNRGYSIRMRLGTVDFVKK